MKKSITNAIDNNMNKIIRACALLISSIILFAYNANAQDGGPSIGNLNKNLAAAKDQMSRQEKMSYLFMALGFILVMGIAWFSTSLAKKRKMEKDEMIRRRHLNNISKHPTHDPYFKTHGHAAKVKHR